VPERIQRLTVEVQVGAPGFDDVVVEQVGQVRVAAVPRLWQATGGCVPARPCNRRRTGPRSGSSPIWFRFCAWCAAYQALGRWPGGWCRGSRSRRKCPTRSFFGEIPQEQEDAARIDGAGPWTMFVRIAVPMARPAFAVVAVLTFLAAWSSFLWPVMMIDQPRVRPLPVEIGVLPGQLPVNWGQLFAFGVLMVAPVLVVFLVFQRWFARGAAVSGRRR
jgi:hypothetical protein